MVTRPGGTKRAVFFRVRKTIGTDTSQADGYPDFRASKKMRPQPRPRETRALCAVRLLVN
jgi:hypothetical protein